MRNFSGLLILFFLLSCGSEGTPPPAPLADPTTLSAPAPGTEPRPVATGGELYQLIELTDFREVEGCTVLLWPENGESGRYVYGFNYAEGPGEGRFGGRLQSLEVEREENSPDSGPNTYVHANDEYEVTTTFTRENQVDSELWEISGTVMIRNRKTGKSEQVRVLGEQGC